MTDHSAQPPDQSAHHPPTSPPGRPTSPTTQRDVPPRSRARGPVTSAERDRMRALARGGASARAIAREVGRSPTTVSRLVGDLFADRREQTRAATETRVVDAAAARADQAVGLLDDLAAVRPRLRSAESTRELADVARALRDLGSLHERFVRVDRERAGGDFSDVDRYLALMDDGASADAVAALMPDDEAGPAA